MEVRRGRASDRACARGLLHPLALSVAVKCDFQPRVVLGFVFVEPGLAAAGLRLNLVRRTVLDVSLASVRSGAALFGPLVVGVCDAALRLGHTLVAILAPFQLAVAIKDELQDDPISAANLVTPSFALLAVDLHLVRQPVLHHAAAVVGVFAAAVLPRKFAALVHLLLRGVLRTLGYPAPHLRRNTGLLSRIAD